MLARISIVPLRSVNQTDSARTRLAIALALAAVVFVIEAAASIFANSLALLAEAFHVLIDLVALGIAFVAVWLAARPPTERRSFGLLRLEILATVLNTVLLLVVASIVLIEGLRRFSEPFSVDSRLVLTAWTRLEKLNDFDEARIDRFIDAYIGIDHHKK